jgi:hypothetical protein
MEKENYQLHLQEAFLSIYQFASPKQTIYHHHFHWPRNHLQINNQKLKSIDHSPQVS